MITAHLQILVHYLKSPKYIWYRLSTTTVISLGLSACTDFSTLPPYIPNKNLEKVEHFNNSQQLAWGIQQAFKIPATTANRLAPIIIEQANLQNISPFLMAALIMQESSYRNHVTSAAGAIGLTQVIPRYWQTKCEGQLHQETDNIKCGTYVLATYSKLAGNWLKALAYYNVGPHAYKNNIKMQQQGIKYARSVSQYHQALLSTLNIQDYQHHTPIHMGYLPP